MKVGDRFTIGGKEYEAVEGTCRDCAFRKGKDCSDNGFFHCLSEENMKNKIVAKEVSR
jgi:hypothetical protein